MNFLKSRKRRRRIARVGDSITHLHLLRAFDVGGHVAGLAHFEPLAHVWLGIEAADLFDFDRFTRMQQFHLHARLELAVEDTDVSNDAFISIKIRIEPQSL